MYSMAKQSVKTHCSTFLGFYTRTLVTFPELRCTVLSFSSYLLFAEVGNLQLASKTLPIRFLFYRAHLFAERNSPKRPRLLGRRVNTRKRSFFRFSRSTRIYKNIIVDSFAIFQFFCTESSSILSCQIARG